MVIVLVIYCCIASYHKLSDLKQHIHILTHSFCGSGIQALLSWILCFRVFHKTTKCHSRLWSHLRLQMGKDLHPSWCGYLQDSLPCRLFNWGPQFLATCWLEATLNFLTDGPLHMAACFIKDSKEDSMLARQKLQLW